MKKFIKKVIRAMARNNFGWLLLNILFIRIADYAKLNSPQEVKSKEFVKSAINQIFPDLTVKHGTFKGMKYAEMESDTSILFPKLLGSFEREIQHIIEELCEQKYTEVVNIGCAEGYYAVGFAIRIPGVNVYAFDNNQECVRLCQNNAKLNNVEQRVIVGSFCDSETLRNIPFRGKGLIISDCEGYETSLFSEEIIPILARHDLLVEAHDGVDINTSSIIRKRFERTHEIAAIESVDDIKKAQTYQYEELGRYSLEERRLLLREGRPAIMQWFYLKSLRNRA